MSDIQELIHKTSMDCIEKGQAMERERIIKLLLEHQPEVGVDSGFVYCSCGISEIWYTEHLIELIKGKTNE